MKPTLASRKPIDSLTPEDFATFPIWEFAMDEEGVDGQDETWVRPVDARAIPRSAYSLAVGARVTLANGRVVTGLCQVSTAGEVEIELVVVVPPGHYVFIPKSSDVGTGPMRRLLEVLGLASVPEFFPAHFELIAPIAGEPSARSGVLA
jgi:hypothetical protein